METFKIGIDYLSDFSEENKSIIEIKIREYIATQVEKKQMSGRLINNEPLYTGFWRIITKDIAEIKNSEIAKQIRQGLTSADSYIYYAQVWESE